MLTHTHWRVGRLASVEQMASAAPLPDLPEDPYHPPAQFKYPKRAFGKAKPVYCSAQRQWFQSWPFLHYDEAKDAVFCHTCVKAFTLKRIRTSHNSSSAFVSFIPLILVEITIVQSNIILYSLNEPSGLVHRLSM